MPEASQPTVLVRPASSRDLPAVGDLWEELMLFHFQRDRRFRTASGARQAFLRHISSTVLPSRDHMLLVGEMDGRVVGFLIGRIEYGGPIFAEPYFGYVTDACVHRDARRLGVGRKMWDAMREWFRRRGMTNVRVSVATENPVSQAFWRDLGFKPFMERLWCDLT